MNAPNIDAIVEKITKLLELANPASGATQGEIENAMLAAKKLAAKYELDLATVAAQRGEDDSPDTGTATITPARSTEGEHHRWILQALKECLGVRFIFLPGQNHDCIGVVGTRLDIQLAMYCFTWLENQFPKSYLQWRKSMGYPKDRMMRRNYYVGLKDGIIEVNKRVTEDMSAADASRYAIVVVNKEAVVDNAFAVAFPQAQARRSIKFKHDEGAMEAGQRAGRAIKLQHGLNAGTIHPALR